MKTITILLLIISFQRCYSQNDFDSLKKYIYPIIGIDSTAVDGGSCFFVRHNKNIYVVTAKHVLAGCLNDSTKSKKFANKHYIFLGNYLNSIVLNTDITKRILSCGGIDFAICQLLDTSMSKYIYSVENLLVPDFTDFKEFTIGGYPATGYATNVFDHYPDVSFMRIQKHHFEILNIADSTGAYNPNIFAIDWKGQVTNADLMSGYSGGPVFIQDRKTLKWKMSGILSAGKNNVKDAVILIVIDAIALLDKLDSPRLPYELQSGILYFY
jgi:hypothetical protein